MRKFILISILVFGLTVISNTQPTPGYFLTYGNPDGSPLVVKLDSDIEVKMWVETPLNGDLNGDEIVDSVSFMINILASNDSFVVSRYGGEVYFPLTTWEDVDFPSPVPDGRLSGYTAQMLLALGDYLDPSEIPVNTESRKVHVASFFMRTSSDSSLLNLMVSALDWGMISPTGQFTYWGLPDGTTIIFPAQTFSLLYFADYAYKAGDANGSGEVNGLDAIYLVNYFKQVGPSPDPLLGGDANGDCLVNGLDVIYLVSFLKGTGYPPQLGICA